MHFFKLIMLAAALKVQLFFVGDSITFGIGTTGYGPSGSNISGTNSYPEQAFALLNNSNLTLVKRGYPGFYAANYVSTGKQANDLALVDTIHFRKRLAVIFFLANDAVIGPDASTVFNNIVAVHAAYHAKGFKTIVVTGMNRIDNGKQIDPIRQQVNTMIRTQWNAFADDIADLAGQPLLDATNAPQNPLYFAVNDVDGLSGVHLTDAGAALLAAEVVKPIRRLVAKGL